MGFYLEFTLEEAEEFINKKVKGLEDKGQDLTNQVLLSTYTILSYTGILLEQEIQSSRSTIYLQANKIKANIKLVLEGLREIQNLPKEDIKKSNYDPLS